jgi:hypothetical protein
MKNGVKAIEEDAFHGCENLENIQLGSAVEFIAMSAFKGCVALQEIVIPASLTVVQSFAFDDCNALESVYYEGEFEAWILGVHCGASVGFENATVYYYSEEEPTEEGNFWYYLDGVSTVWGE